MNYNETDLILWIVVVLNMFFGVAYLLTSIYELLAMFVLMNSVAVGISLSKLVMYFGIRKNNKG